MWNFQLCVESAILHGMRKHWVGTRLQAKTGIASPAAPLMVGSQRMTFMKLVSGFAVRAKKDP